MTIAGLIETRVTIYLIHISPPPLSGRTGECAGGRGDQRELLYTERLKSMSVVQVDGLGRSECVAVKAWVKNEENKGARDL